MIHRLADGRELPQTLNVIRRVVIAAVTDERVTMTARELVSRAGRSELSQLQAIRRWGAANWRFVADPNGIDAITEPATVLEEFYRTGVLLGDCDCAAATMAALAMSIGAPARLATCSWTRDLVHEHIWAEGAAALGGMHEAWLDFDVSVPRGRKPPMTDLAYWTILPPR